jgi:hypothetical protein
MSSGPFDDPQLDAAWGAYAAQDRRLAPSPELEARTLSRCLSAKGAKGAGGQARWIVVTAGLAAASITAAVVLSRPRPAPAVAPIQARAHGVTMLADTASAERPAMVVKTRARRKTGPQLAPAGEPVELAEVLMQFDLAPMRAHEPLQMVRLRLPREALQALGLALLEPDAGGMVDVDVLVGEDGLPRDIRKVRIGQEQR